MTNKNNSFYSQSIHEIGSPIDLLGNENEPRYSNSRVMPSQFSFPTLPIGCTFIRSLGTDRDNDLKR